MLHLAELHGARFFQVCARCGLFTIQASTSEVYGDPEVHPQPESYFGNVNTFGPRACYDEGKRVAETICYAYLQRGIDVRIARIFNTCGSGMRSSDGRVITSFVSSALERKSLTLYVSESTWLISDAAGTTTTPSPALTDQVRRLSNTMHHTRG